MKYPKSILPVSLIAGLFFLASCDVLNIEPEQSLSDEEIFTDASAAEAAVVGMYDGLQEGGAYGGIGIMAADFPTDVSRFTGSFTTLLNIRDYDPISSTNISILDIWADTYNPVNRANNIIEGAEEVPDVSGEVIAGWQGEAMFVRALSHFHLVRYFARPYIDGRDNPGIPLVLEATEEPGEHLNLPRASVGDVYDQIIEDLEFAEANLTAEQAFDGQATVGAAQALLARVYLHQEEWQLAFDHASAVIETSPYQLSADVVTPWADVNYNGPEFIFAVQNRADDQIGVNDAIASFHIPDSEGGRGDIRAFSKLVESFEEDDERLSGLHYETDDESEEGDIFTGKWVGGSQEDNIPVLRMADVYLMRAEAAAELSDYEQALTDLNMIRNRAGASEYDEDDFANGDELIDLILHERYLELSFEGHRKHDFLRRGLDIQDENQGRVIPHDADMVIFPIPAREIDVNSELEQNPGYN